MYTTYKRNTAIHCVSNQFFLISYLAKQLPGEAEGDLKTIEYESSITTIPIILKEGNNRIFIKGYFAPVFHGVSLHVS